MLEIFINGFFVLIYSMRKTGQFQSFIKQLPMEVILTHCVWVIPFILLLSLFSNYLKSQNLEDFFRRYVFSIIIFIPIIITFGDVEFLYWLSAVHLFSTIISFYEKSESKKESGPETSSFLFKLKLAPAQVVLLSFGGLIILGALGLLLPIASVPGKSIGIIDAFFMSTSATCVTGLATLSVVDDLSLFGQMIILILVQIGGLGIMTLSSSMALIMGKNLQMREQIIMQDVLDASGSNELLSLIVDIIRFTFVIEFIGAILLSFGFFQEGVEIGEAIYFGFFHSIMSFCNAGFALFNNSLVDFKFSPWITIPVSILLITGGLGFYVIKELVITVKEKRPLKNLSVHTKIVLSINTLLIGLGTVYLFFGEFLHSFQDMTMVERLQVSFFQSITTRTAGFNTIELNSLHPHSLYMMVLLMFIGAAPGSTGGGVKITTFAILLQSVTATLKGKPHVEFFERRVPSTIVVKSIAVFIISLIVASIGILVLMRIEPDKNFLSLFFEVISGFATVGLSLGITPFLSVLGKLVMVVLMFTGRVGPLTLVIAIGSRVVVPEKIEYPEGKILIG